MALTRSQIDKLGERLLRDPIAPPDYEMLEEYRESFRSAYDTTVETVATQTRLPISGRAAKSTTAIVAKLRRSSTKLSQMQDIAGCRIVVDVLREQDMVADAVAASFLRNKRVDRRAKPSYGYRAVHLITWVEDKPVETQIRTRLQHGWAQLSERLADRFGSSLKYGGGPLELRLILEQISSLIAEFEQNGDGRSVAGPAALQFAQRAKELRRMLDELLRSHDLNVEYPEI